MQMKKYSNKTLIFSETCTYSQVGQKSSKCNAHEPYAQESGHELKPEQVKQDVVICPGTGLKPEPEPKAKPKPETKVTEDL